MTTYTTLAHIVSTAFGGSKGPSVPDITEDLSKSSPDQFISRFNQIMGG